MRINLKDHLFTCGTSLVLHGKKDLTDNDFGQLRDFSDKQRASIKAVVLSNTHISGACFPHLALLPNLEALYCGGTQVTDDAPFYLLTKSIETINLDRTKISDGCISNLTKLKRLRLLSLRETRITDSGLHRLGALPSLREYYLNDTIVSAFAKQRLGNAIKLKDLTFATAPYLLLCFMQFGAGKIGRFIRHYRD